MNAWWCRWRVRLLRLGVVVMGSAATVWLAYQFWRLLSAAPPIWPGSVEGAIDLEMLQAWGQRWFRGIDAYLSAGAAPYPASTYPPASYVLLWPLTGWLGFGAARLLWAATTVAALVWLIRILLRESGAETALERAFVALMPLSIYPTGATIGNGQLMVHLLPLLIVAALRLQRPARGWRRDLAVALLFLGALAKPTVAAPFFWIVLFGPAGLAPALLSAAGYLLLTLFAGLFQSASLEVLLAEWAARALDVSARASLSLSHSNLHGWLTSQELEQWNLAASLGVLAALGLWVARYRGGDLWLRLGVTALVTRFLSYHGWYDDLLILLPMVALFRTAKGRATGMRPSAAAGLLLALLLVMMLAPGGQYLLPQPWAGVWMAVQASVWAVVLGYLVWRTHQEAHIASLSPPAVRRVETTPESATA